MTPVPSYPQPRGWPVSGISSIAAMPVASTAASSPLATSAKVPAPGRPAAPALVAVWTSWMPPRRSSSRVVPVQPASASARAPFIPRTSTTIERPIRSNGRADSVCHGSGTSGRARLGLSGSRVEVKRKPYPVPSGAPSTTAVKNCRPSSVCGVIASSMSASAPGGR